MTVDELILRRALESEATKLRAALLKYGYHRGDCDSLHRTGYLCTCGFTRFWKELEVRG